MADGHDSPIPTVPDCHGRNLSVRKATTLNVVLQVMRNNGSRSCNRAHIELQDLSLRLLYR